MQKDKMTLLIVILVVAAGLFAAEWYFFDYRTEKALKELEGVGPMPESSKLSGDGRVSAETYETRDSEIIECEDPEVGKFYTDAESCEEAELEQAAEPPPELPAED